MVYFHSAEVSRGAATADGTPARSIRSAAPRGTLQQQIFAGVPHLECTAACARVHCPFWPWGSCSRA
ncbi:hypothetical protein GQ600_27749 [Phytophthora cactorum]|nr:hypothetical protein GQ600_27749 [Phytophthora cactorum]